MEPSRPDFSIESSEENVVENSNDEHHSDDEEEKLYIKGVIKRQCQLLIESYTPI